jgi:hypothetical protein
MIQLQRWTAELIACRVDADERNLLHRNAIWHVIRRRRCRHHLRAGHRRQNAISKPLATGQQIGGPLTGHTALVSSVAFSPDGRRIVAVPTAPYGCGMRTRAARSCVCAPATKGA